MNEFQLKYGTNPNQKPARIYMADGSDLPVQILNGRQLQARLPRRCGHRSAAG